ncbi:MAG: ABC-type multidrug transport system, ATPase and permease component [Verrucomicrobiota bacterium]|jgi:ATP-binding cassette subfamily B protein/subfamily B ATP-binding cassette protein MsbA
MGIYRRTLAYYRPFLGQTLVALVLGLVVTGFNLLKPWPFKYIVDGVLTPGGADSKAQLAAWFGPVSPPTLILLLCLTMVGITVLAGLANLGSSYLLINVGLKSLLRIRTELYAHLQRLSLKFHDTRRSSDSSFRVAYDTQSIQTIFNRGFTNIFGSGVMFVSTFVIMVRLDAKLTLLSLAVVPLIVFTIYWFAKKIRSQSTTIQERESALLATLQEGLASVRMVHAFGQEDREVGQFRDRAGESLRANLHLTFTNVSSALVVGTLMAVGTAVLYYTGSMHVLEGKLTLGDLLVFASYLLMLYAPLEQLTYTAWAMEGAAAGAKRCFDILDREDDVRDAPHAKPLHGVGGDIRFSGVDFGYDDSRRILHNVSLEIRRGESVAIVGGTGAGKSTLLSLVPRFYDPTRGEVAVEGNDLRGLRKKSLRANISMVLQDTLLFSTTVRENIAYGRPNATENEIIEAAKRAQAYDFIMRIPDGFSSQVGERGGHLSVGQRQRIGIARAFLKNAPILLLDEPTSALDATTEKAVMETIAELMKGRTTLMVTHRLNTAHRFDRIIVLEQGEVVEQGPADELLARGGAYAKMFAAGHYES